MTLQCRTAAQRSSGAYRASLRAPVAKWHAERYQWPQSDDDYVPEDFVPSWAEMIVAPTVPPLKRWVPSDHVPASHGRCPCGTAHPPVRRPWVAPAPIPSVYRDLTWYVPVPWDRFDSAPLYQVVP